MATAAWWRFSEGSGTSAADSSGNGNTATLTGATWVTGLVAGGFAVDCDGTNDQIDISAVLGEFNASEGTICFFGKIGAMAAFGQILNIRVNGDNEVDIGWVDAAGETFMTYTAGTVMKRIQTTAAVDDAAQHHFALSWSVAADQVKAYIDGTQVGATLTGLGTWVGTPTIGLVGNNAFNEYGKIIIDDLRIYTTALSASTIANIAAGGDQFVPNRLHINQAIRRASSW